VAPPPETTEPELAPSATPLADAPVGTSSFSVRLENFEGPFDLLLGLISRHQLDITEIALAQVTDEFIAHLRAADELDLGQASEFLVVAATLLDLKAARLLPQGDVEDAEDLELLEARDLLFARLLQYRAFKEVASSFAERLESSVRRYPRTVPLEPELAALLPELVWSIGPHELAYLAAKALEPKAPPTVDVSHLHGARVSVREQAAVVADRLRRAGTTSFRALVADAGEVQVVIARFLALLELFREGVLGFEQVTPLGELTVRWTGSEDAEVEIRDDYDDGGNDIVHHEVTLPVDQTASESTPTDLPTSTGEAP